MTDEEVAGALAKCSPENRPKLRERQRTLSPAESDELMVSSLGYS